ncbi:MAG: DUF5717 family protein, partial [Lachnospiraceae bacterium]|nr:DUF5717 family protein [Lachnospiraceae bacterium]
MKRYTRALSFGSTINNLYKAILESLPRNYEKKLPLYVYRYFYEDRSYTFEQKISLYENVILAFTEVDDIYKLYYDEIRQFALSEIYQNKISESLVKLYKSILKVDIINKDNASNILYLVRNYKLTVKNNNIRYVIIKYKETKNETEYEIVSGICYLPVFFDSYVLLFEDISGNILYDIDYDLKVLFDEKDIENACLSICQDKNLFYFSKFLDIKEKKDISNIDIEMYFEIYNNLSLNLSSIYNVDK